MLCAYETSNERQANSWSVRFLWRGRVIVKHPAAIILDGNQRSALAATRALGKLKLVTYVGETHHNSLAASSRYCQQSLVYPDPASTPAEFIAWLAEIDKRWPGTVLMPMSDVTVPLVLRSSFRNLRTALPSLGAYEAVSDKLSLFRHATESGVRVPRTHAVTRQQIRMLDTLELRYPVVVKPRHSSTRTEQGVLKRTVKYARSREELSNVVAAMLKSDEEELLLQEYISGRGEGVFALYQGGDPKFFFAHRRLREKPPSGGVSVLCESVRLTEPAVRAARKMLDPLNWHGVAMVEFKVDEAGEPWLIEINARFWGSLQLAVDCGANFPEMLYQLARNGETTAPAGFKAGQRLRWLLGDIDNLYATLKSNAYSPRLIDKVGAIARFIVPWSPGMRYEFLRLSDPAPAFYAVNRYVRSFGRQ